MVGRICRYETRDEICRELATVRAPNDKWYCRKHFAFLELGNAFHSSSPPPAPSPSLNVRLRMATFEGTSYGEISIAFNEFFSKKPDVDFEHCEMHDQMLHGTDGEFTGYVCVVVYYE
jgi:hypothetical protein